MATTKQLPKGFAPRLAYAMNSFGISLQQLADESTLSIGTLESVLDGSKRLSVEDAETELIMRSAWSFFEDFMMAMVDEIGLVVEAPAAPDVPAPKPARPKLVPPPNMSFIPNTRRLDLTGVSFGKLTALRPDGDEAWVVRCDGCGLEKTASTSNLRSGKTKSCGSAKCSNRHRRRELVDAA